MKVNKEELQSKIEYIISNGIVEMEEVDITTTKIIEIIKPLIIALEVLQESRDNKLISVEERLPEIIPNSNGGCSEDVLVWIENDVRNKLNEYQKQIAYYTNDGWCYEYGELMIKDDAKGLTHWQQLPERPTRKENKDEK
jgi:hypothetical protein